MMLDKSIIYLDPPAGRERYARDYITIKNPSDEPLYVESIVLEVHNPGAEAEQHLPVSQIENMSLLVNPNRVIIPPGQESAVQIFSTKVPKMEEQVYRVTFKPVIPELKAEGSGVKVVVAHQVLIFIRPEKRFITIDASRDGNELTLTNNGNHNIQLRRGVYCQEENDCTNLPTERLYAGQSHTLTLPDSVGFVEYGLFNGRTEKRKRY